MNVDVERATRMITQGIRDRLGDEVELVFRYGSTLTGNPHEFSDLDISYVPIHEATWDSITVLVDETSLPFMEGSELDFVDDLIGASFQVKNPNATASCGCGTSFSI